LQATNELNLPTPFLSHERFQQTAHFPEFIAAIHIHVDVLLLACAICRKWSEHPAVYRQAGRQDAACKETARTHATTDTAQRLLLLIGFIGIWVHFSHWNLGRIKEEKQNRNFKEKRTEAGSITHPQTEWEKPQVV
jgi:hypothetical protein